MPKTDKKHPAATATDSSVVASSRSRIKVLFFYFLILMAAGWISWSVLNTGYSIQAINQNLINRQLPALNQVASLSQQVVVYERILYERYATISVDNYDRKPTQGLIEVAVMEIESDLSALNQEYPQNPSVLSFETLFRSMQQYAEQLDQALPPEPWDWDEARLSLSLISNTRREFHPLIKQFEAEINQQIMLSKLEADQKLKSMSIWVVGFVGSILIIAVLVGINIRNERRRSFERLRLATFVEKNPNPIACMDYQGDLVFTNFSWEHQLTSAMKLAMVKKVLQLLDSLKSEPEHSANLTHGENNFYYSLSIHHQANLSQFIIYVENITEREVARRELEFLAYHDSLTGLSNIKKLELDIQQQIEQCKDNQFYLLSIGIKRLQLITTTHGHSVSDALIRAIVIRLQNVLVELVGQFKICRIYRLMGAKFEVLLADTKNARDFNLTLQRFNQKIQEASKKPLNTNFGQFYLGMQVGCAIYPDHGYSASMLLKNASAALNEAQRDHIDGVHLFNHEIAHREQSWFKLENDLRQVQYEQEFFLVYQPKIDLQSHQLVGMEALIRWRHPEKGLVSPAEFIPVAEESGMLIAIGEWILNSAVVQIRRWLDAGYSPCQIAINVSPNQLLSTNFVDKVLESLERYQIGRQWLEIEITEEVMVEDIERCVDVIVQLKQAGISIAIDDFGTGYSSLAYLNRLPFSKLKIDRSFVSQLPTNPNNQAIVSTIIGLSQSLKMTVIAEGIETEAELTLLDKMGCDQGQGYWFSKPLTATEFESKYLQLASTPAQRAVNSKSS